MKALRQRLKRIPFLRRAYHDLDILWKYGRLRPERMTLSGSEHVIFVDPREARGRALLRSHGHGQRRLKSLWRTAVARLSPDIVLDVGANYGEFTFLVRYPGHTRIVAIEANAELQGYLARSRAEHPDRDRIQLVSALASDSVDDRAAFYVDREWSGRSSALNRSHLGSAVEVTEVSQTTVDRLLNGLYRAGSRLLFKIDVEGAETQVLRGMRDVLATCETMVGMIELDEQNLRQLGVNLDAHIGDLAQRFLIFAFDPHGQLRSLAAHPIRTLFPGDVKTDLILVSDEATARAMQLPMA